MNSTITMTGEEYDKIIARATKAEAEIERLKEVLVAITHAEQLSTAWTLASTALKQGT